jgi:hypothetical protein
MPGFTAVAIGSIALGIGANAAIFTLVDQVLLRVLRVHNPHELVQLTFQGMADVKGVPEAAEHAREHLVVVAELLVYGVGQLTTVTPVTAVPAYFAAVTTRFAKSPPLTLPTHNPTWPPSCAPSLRTSSVTSEPGPT